MLAMVMVGVAVVAAATAEQAYRAAGRGRLCLIQMKAPVGSCWQRLGDGARRVPLSRLLRVVRQHNLKLREGRLSPHSSLPHLAVTCHSRRRMWAVLPQANSLPHTLEDDSSSFPCFCERGQEFFMKLFGVLRWSPEQEEGAPERHFMPNYCGIDLPVKNKPVGGKRMYKETLRLEKELLALP
ncbi:hypothetical protein E2C01_066874 [Portunus trituberculatus]|uniref:Uncharacterized protein n=1 Tax=Portunus trituberculatus TaxID=210409 RepID=A0A5B7HMP9_PORTR|nr:hypothetical protein [Portunus trituberculatus]